jgi:hypothetical protein
MHVWVGGKSNSALQNRHCPPFNKHIFRPYLINVRLLTTFATKTEHISKSNQQVPPLQITELLTIKVISTKTVPK